MAYDDYALFKTMALKPIKKLQSLACILSCHEKPFGNLVALFYFYQAMKCFYCH